MTIYPVQDVFVRGEISPRLHARASLDLYRAALSKCENFITLPHGGLRKRGGTYFVDEVPDSGRKARLIPFVFSDDQAYALVLGDFKLRVYAYGARVGVVEVVTPWSSDQIWEISFTQSADVIWFVHPDFAPRTLTRTAHTVWTLETVEFTDGPFDPVNTFESNTMYVSATTGAITITSSVDLFSSPMVGTLVRLDMKTYEAIPPWEPNAIIPTPTLNLKRRYNGNVYKSMTNIATSVGNAYQVKTGATPPTHVQGTEWDGQQSFLEEIPNIGGTLPDYYHGIQWTYLHSGFGVARIASIIDAQHATATVLATFPDETVGAGNASHLWRFGAPALGDQFSSVALYEDRLTYARRISVYASKTGQFKIFKTGEKGDDALAFTNAGSGHANDIVWLRDIDGFLAIGTIGGIRGLSGAGIDEALTPSSFKNRNSRTISAARIAPVEAGSSFVYVAKGRKKLAELKLGQNLRFESSDLGQISEHIAKKGVIEIAFQEYPDPILWFPLDNGEVGSFTFQPSQDVRGMHRQRFGGVVDTTEWGQVESSCVTPGQTGEDDVWFIVKRTIDGETRRYIEIGTPLFEYGSIEDAFQVDCGLSYDGAAVNEVAGAGHLRNETVDVLADGVVYKGLTVSNAGDVMLPGGATAGKWHLGLPFESGADTLELDVGAKDGSLIGRKKRILKVILSLFETDISGLQISSMQKERWENVRLPSVAAPSRAAVLFTGNIEVPIDDSWAGQGRVKIRHVNPTPCTIRAMTPGFDAEP